MFAHGHAYTALSRAKRWDDVELLSLNWAAVKADPDAVAEYARLEKVAQTRSDQESFLRGRGHTAT